MNNLAASSTPEPTIVIHGTSITGKPENLLEILDILERNNCVRSSFSNFWYAKSPASAAKVYEDIIGSGVDCNYDADPSKTQRVSSGTSEKQKQNQSRFKTSLPMSRFW